MKTVIGVFAHESDAQEALVMLKNNGFEAEDISVMMKDHAMGTEVEHKTGGHLVEGAAGGATTGAVVGGIAGLLVGIGALTIPGIGAFVIGGPLAAALGLTGAAATTVTGATTGAVAGGLIGALMGLGLSKDEAQVYEERLKEGALLVAIPVTEEREAEVRTILSRFNATDVTSVHVPTDRVRATSARLENRDQDPYVSTGMKGDRTAVGRDIHRRASSFRAAR